MSAGSVGSAARSLSTTWYAATAPAGVDVSDESSDTERPFGRHTDVSVPVTANSCAAPARPAAASTPDTDHDRRSPWRPAATSDEPAAITAAGCDGAANQPRTAERATSITTTRSSTGQPTAKNRARPAGHAVNEPVLPHGTATEDTLPPPLTRHTTPRDPEVTQTPSSPASNRTGTPSTGTRRIRVNRPLSSRSTAWSSGETTQTDDPDTAMDDPTTATGAAPDDDPDPHPTSPPPSATTAPNAASRRAEDRTDQRPAGKVMANSAVTGWRAHVMVNPPIGMNTGSPTSGSGDAGLVLPSMSMNPRIW